MRSGLVLVAGLMMAAVAGAQQATPQVVMLGPTGKVLPGYVILGAGCPGQLTARQQATGGATVWTTALEDQDNSAPWIAKQTGLGIHIDFSGAKGAVKELELRVSYLPLGLRRMPAAPMVLTTAVSPQERAKTFNLDRDAAMRIDADLLVGPAATITRVHLMSATFADGTVWRAPNQEACTIEPSRVMLVADKH